MDGYAGAREPETGRRDDVHDPDTRRDGFETDARACVTVYN